MPPKVFTIRDAVIQFFSEHPQHATQDMRLFLSQLLARHFHSVNSDPDALRQIIATQIEIPEWKIFLKEVSIEDLGSSSEALEAFVKGLKAYLDRKHVIEERGIENGQTAVCTDSRARNEHVSVQIQPDYHITVRSITGRRRTLLLHPGKVRALPKQEVPVQERVPQSEPANTFVTGSPLEFARLLAVHEGVTAQDRAQIVCNIVGITHDAGDLQMLLPIWEEAQDLPPKTAGVIGSLLVHAYLECQREKDAIKIIQKLPEEECVIAYVRLYQFNGLTRHITTANRIAGILPLGQRVFEFFRVAQASRSEENLRQAQETLRVLIARLDVGNKHWQTLLLWEVCTLLKFELYDEARDAVVAIRNSDLRIEGRSEIASATQDADDLALVILDLKDHGITLTRGVERLVHAFEVCKRLPFVREYFSARTDIHVRCLAFSLIAMAIGGNRRDMTEAEKAFLGFPKSHQERADVIDHTPARVQTVKALAHWNRREDALAAAASINHKRTVERANAYLAIHTADQRK